MRNLEKKIALMITLAVFSLLTFIVACSLDDDVNTEIPTASITYSSDASLSLSADDYTLEADEAQETGLGATLRDNNGQPIAGVQVMFWTDVGDVFFEPELGSESEGYYSIATTNSNGIASVILRAGTTPGSVNVYATDEMFGLVAQITIKLTDVGQQPSAGELNIYPDSVSFGVGLVGETVDFFVTGGQPPYEWLDIGVECGTLTESSDSDTDRHDIYTYEVTTEITCVDNIIVIDDVGTVVSASVSVGTTEAE